MFSFHDFIMKGMLGAVGRQADYWVINQAAGWQQKGVLEMEDLAEIDQAIQDYHAEQERLAKEAEEQAKAEAERAKELEHLDEAMEVAPENVKKITPAKKSK